jgi:hypothetical protein
MSKRAAPDEGVENDTRYAMEIAEIASDVHLKWDKLMGLHEDKKQIAQKKKVKSYDYGLDVDGFSFENVACLVGVVVRAAVDDVEKHGGKKAKLADIPEENPCEKTDEEITKKIAEIATDVHVKWEVLLGVHNKKLENAKEHRIKNASYDFGLEGDFPTFDDVYGVFADVSRDVVEDVAKYAK